MNNPFEPHRLYTLRHSASGSSFAFLPHFGGALQSLVLGGVEVLDGNQTAAEAEANRWSKGRLLFPFPNRLRDGAYTWEGQSYQFPINDPGTGNALHGLGVRKVFTVSALREDDTLAEASCVYHHVGDDPAFPFPFLFTATYRVAGNHFEVELSLQNRGHRPMPAGMGWHPYFRLGDTIDECSLQLPALELVGIDERMIPTGKRYPYSAFAQLSPIGATVLDNCFVPVAPPAEVSLTFVGPRGGLRYWQEYGPGKYPFIQLFTPPHRQSLAIEPMSCNIDAFHNGEGLVPLLPDETLRARSGVEWIG